jgi:hypothetical protein
VTRGRGDRTRLLAASLLAFGLATGGPAAAAPEVVVSSGTISPAGLPYSSFLGVGLGDGGHTAVLATTTAVFRAVRDGAGARAVRVFAPGDQVGGRTVIGTDAPALAPNGCVLARLAFADGGTAIYRRCGDAVERVAGEGDAVGPRTIRSIEPSVVTSAGGYAAFTARVSDGNVAVVRGGLGPLVEIARTGGSSPAGGTISSLRVIGVRTTGVVGFAATVVDGRDGLFEGDGTAVRKVIVEGDGSLDGTVNAIDGASMNGDGIFAFLGELDDADGTRGVFRADARPPLPQVAMIVRVGEPSPSIAGGIFARFPTSVVPAINADGDVAFRVTLGGDTTGAGVFVGHASGGVEKIATTREKQADLDERSLTRLRDPVIADDGSVLVVAAPPSEGVGLFLARDGGISELIRFGDPSDVGTLEQRFRFVSPSVAGDAADAVFLGHHDVVLAVDPGGNPRIVAQLGMETPVRGTFSELDVPAVGGDGRVAFRGEVLDGKTGQGVFVDEGKGPVAVAKAGRGAPGPGRFRDFPAALSDTASVDVAGTQIGFLASLFGTNSFEGIFLKRKGSGGGKSLARTNKRAPGGGEYVAVEVPTVLDAKHYAFSGLVRDDATRQAIFWRDGGKTRIVTRQGLETTTRLGGRFQSFSAPDLGSGGLVFRSEVSPVGQHGLFLAVDTRRGLLLAGGDPSDGPEAFRTFDRPVWAGASVAFSGSLAGVPSLRGLFVVTPDGLPAPEAGPRPAVTLLREGRPAPGGGTIVDVRPPVGNAQGLVASVVRIESGPAQQIVARVDVTEPPSP